MKFNFSIGKFSLNLGREDSVKTGRRGFDAANLSRLNSDWLFPQTDADSEVQSGIKILRGRARELERNNEYAVRYLDLIDNNVLGSCGVGLQMKISDPQGTLDKIANDVVLKAWKKWNQRKYCSANGQLCWREVESLVLRRSACDGGILVRHMRGWDNPFGYAVQPLEIDHLDIDYNVTLNNGNLIRFGIETDKFQRIVAFHLFKAHPGGLFMQSQQRERILASDLLHIRLTTRPNQTIGTPWFSCVMQALEHLGKYKEAELVAARLEACKGYVIEREKIDGWDGQTDENDSPIQEMSPGMGVMLDPGQKYVGINPNHPNSAFGDFFKSSLRGIAGGLGVNYNSLANDLESVNYSSMRAGKLEEIEEYKNIQAWLIESLHTPVFEAWLEMALISGALRAGNGSALPTSKYDKFNAPDWKPRRWPWVDPLKDLQASVLAVEKGFKSRREIISEMGGDIEEVFRDQNADEELADKYDLEFPIGNNPQQPPGPDDAQNPKEDSKIDNEE